jgi:hypothetical protein
MKIRVRFELEVPDMVSTQEVDEWLRYKLGIWGHILNSNRLVDADLNADPHSLTVTKA